VTAPQQQAFPIGGAFRDCPDCPEMVVLPGGAFQMGAEGGEQGRPEGPVRTVTIPRPFAVGKTEVTTAQYEAFVRETGHTPSTDCRRWVQADRRVMALPASVGSRMGIRRTRRLARALAVGNRRQSGLRLRQSL
jgi:formylglycine-generating enzyme required for sulfatase activity